MWGTSRLPAVVAALFASFLLGIPALGVAANDAAAPRPEASRAAPEASAPVAGDGGAEGSGAMDLDQLIRRAISANKGLAAAHIAVTVAEEDINVARGQFRPRLDAFSTLEHFPIRDKVLIARAGGPEQNNPFEETVLNYGIEITLPLYTGGHAGASGAVPCCAESTGNGFQTPTTEGLTCVRRHLISSGQG